MDCTLDNFIGTWKGKVEFEGDELEQGPYVLEKGEDGASLQMTDETGAIFTLTVENCIATNIVEEEGMTMNTTYTYEEGALQILSMVEFPDGAGNVVKSEMKGSMSKVD